jgi:parallel beta-helix repeat protein
MRYTSHKALTFGALVSFFPLLQAEAAQYFVSSNGSDSANGTSVTTPFRTPERAFRALAAGDSIYLRAGDYWRLGQALSVNVSGTEQSPVVIGAYSVNSSGDVELSVHEGRPILDGATAAPRLGDYTGVIDVRGRRHVHIRDLEIRNSGGYGVKFVDTALSTVENVKVDWAYHSGIFIERSTDVTIAACEVIGDSHGWSHYGTEYWGGGIAFMGAARVEVRDCLVREGYGEAISAFMGSSDIVFSGNKVFAARAVGIYVNSSYNVEISNNMVLGTADSTFHRSSGWPGPGIVLGNEAYQYRGSGGSLSTDVYTRNVKIVNNLVAATATGVAFWSEISAPMEGVEVAHNSFVDNEHQINMMNISYRSVSIGNNIFLSLSSGTRDAQDIASSGITWRSNYWSGGPPTASARHSGDVHSGLTLRRMTGWRSLRQESDATWSDFEPTPGSPTIGRGTATTVSTDFNGAPLRSPPDVGALTYRGSASSRPSRPIIVSLSQ